MPENTTLVTVMAREGGRKKERKKEKERERERPSKTSSGQTVWHAEWYICGINLSVVCMIGPADVTRYVNGRVFTRRHLW